MSIVSKLDWQSVPKIEDREDPLQEVLSQHNSVFNEKLWMLKGITAKIHVASNTRPCA